MFGRGVHSGHSGVQPLNCCCWKVLLPSGHSCCIIEGNEVMSSVFYLGIWVFSNLGTYYLNSYFVIGFVICNLSDWETELCSVTYRNCVLWTLTYNSS